MTPKKRKSGAEKPPPEPTRTQPDRAGKRKEPLTTEQLGGATPGTAKPAKLVAFVTTAASRPRLAAIEELGRTRRKMAELAGCCVAPIFNGVPPPSMTYGPVNGAGAGWYDARLQIFGCGVGNADFIVANEVAPEKPQMVLSQPLASPPRHPRLTARARAPQKVVTRDGAVYFTLFERRSTTS